jgi:hypothetical protein
MFLSELPPPSIAEKVPSLGDWKQLVESYKKIIKSYKLKVSISYDVDLEMIKHHMIEKFKEF